MILEERLPGQEQMRGDCFQKQFYEKVENTKPCFHFTPREFLNAALSDKLQWDFVIVVVHYLNIQALILIIGIYKPWVKVQNRESAGGRW